MDEQFIQFLMQLPQEQLKGLFQPFQQEQGVLDQQMDIASKMQQQGPQHSTPWGALIGGLSDALGKGAGAYKQGQALKGQTELGQRMQGDAANRLGLMGKAAEDEAKRRAMLDAINLSPAAML